MIELNISRRFTVPPLLLATLLLLMTSLALPLNAAAQKLATPSSVQGVKAAFPKSDGSVFRLSWRANPAQEKVDRYAIYAAPWDPHHRPLDRQAGYLFGYATENSYTIYQKTSIFESKAFLEFPYGGMVLGKGNGSYFWVVAHNSAGWGSNDLWTPNPDGDHPRSPQYPSLQNFLYVEFPCPPYRQRDYPCKNP